MTRVYYKEAVGAFVVFDVTRGSTFEAVSKWKHDLDSKVLLPNGSPIPAVLLANKCDQKKDGSQNPSQMDQFCREGGFVGWFETSAKVSIKRKHILTISIGIRMDEDSNVGKKILTHPNGSQVSSVQQKLEDL